MKYPHRKQRSAQLGILVVALSLFLAACGSSGSDNGSEGSPKKVVIAYQPGIGYAPLIVVKSQKHLEKQFPDTEIEWKKLNSGAAITDGILSGQIQVGAGGTGPLILDWAKDTGIKSLAAMNSADLWLNAMDPKIKSVKDFKKTDKIAMPSPTSVQSVVLRKAAKEYLGDAKALDSTIVSMGHPDGVSALLSDQIQGHLTSPPFQFQEVDKGAHRILGSKDLFGTTTFLHVFMKQDYYDGHAKFAKGLYDELVKSAELINSDPDKAAKALSDEAGGTPEPAEFKKWITNAAIEFTTEPAGLMKVSNFMKEIGMIDKKAKSWHDFTLPTLKNSEGS